MDRQQEYDELVYWATKVLGPPLGQNIAELKASELNRLIDDRAAEAEKLVEALESGLIMTSADIEKARARLSEINDEMSRAHRAKQQLARKRQAHTGSRS